MIKFVQMVLIISIIGLFIAVLGAIIDSDVAWHMKVLSISGILAASSVTYLISK